MRIDLNQLSLGNIGNEDGNKKASSKNSGAASIEDTASFSSDHLDIASLTAQALNSPSVRDAKVSALRQAIQKGEYSVHPQEVAAAMIAHYKR
jgi:flagellar biosynthesis anti-sigma factor FlgM